MGGQRADQIAVLPDMNGIVAEFHCIERPSWPSGSKGVPGAEIYSEGVIYAVPVNVWTSEGSAVGGSANVFVPSSFKACGAQEAPKPVQKTPAD
jgi:hypothetical protein